MHVPPETDRHSTVLCENVERAAGEVTKIKVWDLWMEEIKAVTAMISCCEPVIQPNMTLYAFGESRNATMGL